MDQNFVYFDFHSILFQYENIVRTSAWSFEHSHPDPSSVPGVLSSVCPLIVVILKNKMMYFFHLFRGPWLEQLSTNGRDLRKEQ